MIVDLRRLWLNDLQLVGDADRVLALPKLTSLNLANNRLAKLFPMITAPLQEIYIQNNLVLFYCFA
jgi:Leucine-rich repeat (LRR) protein